MTIAKPSYAASAALTSTALQSLASDTNLLAGWSSAVIDNTANLSDDDLMSVVLKAGTAPTANTVAEIWAWAILDDTPTYPDAINGSQGAKTLTSSNVKSAALKLLGVITFDATTNRLYYFSASVAQAFGGMMPKKYGFFIVHNSAVALASSGNVVTSNPIQLQNV
jgi:hypothetical protein